MAGEPGDAPVQAGPAPSQPARRHRAVRVRRDGARPRHARDLPAPAQQHILRPRPRPRPRRPLLPVPPGRQLREAAPVPEQGRQCRVDRGGH